MKFQYTWAGISAAKDRPQAARLTLPALFCTCLLGGCGFKGPLYLPDEGADSAPATEQNTTAPASDNDDDREDENG